MACSCLLLRLTRKLNRKLPVVVAAASIAILFELVALAAFAQTSRRRTATDSERAGFGATHLSSGPLIFLPAVDYDSGGSFGSSAALADVNGDGKPDVIVTNEDSNSVGVLLGNGDGAFGTAKAYNSGGTYPSSVAVADVNGDGKPDLVVANLCDSSFCTHGTVAVLLGNGDGTFQAAVTYGSGGYFSNSVAIGDVNGDGKPDIVVTNQCPNSSCSTKGTVAVLLGNGKGTFQPAVTYNAGGQYTSAVHIADVNGDGHLDLVVANACQSASTCIAGNEVGVLLGNGDGTFQSPVTYGSGGFSAWSVAVADVNGDGKPDILVANLCSDSSCPTNTDTTVGVLLGNGNGTFQLAVPYDSGGQEAHAVALADVNGDGKPDLVVSNSCADNKCVNGSVAVLQGNGDGTFQSPVAYYSGGFEAYTVLVADLNGDGKPDLMVALPCTIPTSFCSGGALGVLLNNNGAPATTTSIATSANPIRFNQVVTYNATVAGGSGGTLSGTVTFADGGTPIATVTLTNNKASFSTSYAYFGSHPITAAYSGIFHTAEGSRSSTLTEYVDYNSKTVLTTSASPTFVGQPVTFTAAVSSPNGTIPNGELVKFYDGNTLLASVPLASQKATFTTSSLSAKTHGMKAIYVGDTTFASSTGYVQQVVERYPTTTSLSSGPNPSNFGQTVTMTATVKSTAPQAPTGKVVFYDGSTWIGAATLSGGVATITRSNLAVGTHPLTAKYSGDTISANSTSAVVNQVVH